MSATYPRPLNLIAGEIRKLWHPVYFAAVPYLDAMLRLENTKQYLMSDSGADIVQRFLGNAQYWRGEDAVRIKNELRAHLGLPPAKVRKAPGTKVSKDSKAPRGEQRMFIDGKLNPEYFDALAVKNSAVEKMAKQLTDGNWSPKLRAFVGCILGVEGEEGFNVDPLIYGTITVTSDGCLIGNCGEHMGAFLGAYDDLQRNFSTLVAQCVYNDQHMNAEERAFCVERFNIVVQDIYGYNGKKVQ